MTTPFRPYEIIQKKRDKKRLTQEEINWMIQGLMDGSVADYQMSAFLMAIFLNGMDKNETAALTDAMLYSGKMLRFNSPLFVDKHSTGGVGDKTSFILAPIAASLGVKVPMMAGRGLGHTGGTVDKIESIPHFNTNLNLDVFEKLLREKGIVLIGQTSEIAPADKKIYALRDVTATIESIPLITASIMSKKLAEGASGIVMDIKTGSGAFMSRLSDAKKLATSIRKTCQRFNKNIMTVISDMNAPLGLAVGNSLEIIECIEVLKNRGPKDLYDLSVTLAGGMVYLAGIAKTHAMGIKMAIGAIDNGTALEKFREMIRNQGGDEKIVDDYSRLPQAECTFDVKATANGYLSTIDCKNIGGHVVSLGGGRKTMADKIDHAVGIVLQKKIGQQVKKGEILATIYHQKTQLGLATEISQVMIKNDFKISKSKLKSKPKLIIEIKTKKLFRKMK